MSDNWLANDRPSDNWLANDRPSDNPLAKDGSEDLLLANPDEGGRVRAAYAAIKTADRGEVWILLRPEAEVQADFDAISSRAAAGDELPLAGLLLAVKDNIDVAGLPTTAGCPAYAYTPSLTAPAVSRLLAAGAVLVGKTNLDQFATGLVGARSPFGAVRDARRPNYVSGGSSSGSAVAVALGLVDIALGTDTAGSGRVPAAFGGIVGLKPTYGLIPTRGVVPACRELDCVSVFAATVALAQQAIEVMTGPDSEDPTSRSWPLDRPLSAPPSLRLAVPRPDQLGSLSPSWQAAWTRAVERLIGLGAVVEDVDISSFLTAGSLLYGGAFIASRYAAVGAFIDEHPDDVDPSVRTLICGGANLTAAQWVADTERLQTLALDTRAVLKSFDALVLPTVPRQPSLLEVAADPIGANAALGEFTTFCNLLDLAAVAVPAGEVDGGQFGISVVVGAFAARFAGEVALTPPLAGIALLVLGAHLTGLPLNHQLTSRGARLLETVQTAPEYRMFALDSVPPKPGLQRVTAGGASIVGELWDVPEGLLSGFLAALPTPMALGQVQLDDGRSVVGFQCEAVAVEGALDVTSHGGWRAYLGRS
jgi:allophanate hydrolase